MKGRWWVLGATTLVACAWVGSSVVGDGATLPAKKASNADVAEARSEAGGQSVASEDQEGLIEVLARDWDRDREDRAKVEPAPASALETSPKGAFDPYPRADQITLHNVALATDFVLRHGEEQELRGLERWNGMAGFSVDLRSGTNRNDPNLLRAEDQILDLAATCRSLENLNLPPRAEVSSDLADFVVPLRALQGILTQNGILFAPVGTRDWKLIRLTSEIEGDDGTAIQSFTRIVGFMTTASPEALKKVVTELAAARGYEVVPLPRTGKCFPPPGMLLLKQRVTAITANHAMLTMDDDDSSCGYDDSTPPDRLARLEKAEKGMLNCLVTDQIGENWLRTINLATNVRHTVTDARIGYLVQSSVIPLGKDTEEFTNAHVAERMRLEKDLTPAQRKARQEALEERLERETLKRSANYKKMLEVMGEMAELEQRSLPEQRAVVDKLFGNSELGKYAAKKFEEIEESSKRLSQTTRQLRQRIEQ